MTSAQIVSCIIGFAVGSAMILVIFSLIERFG